MNLYYFLHCQITKSKDFFLTNGDEGFAFYELTVLTILDQFFNVHFFLTLQLQLYWHIPTDISWKCIEVFILVQVYYQIGNKYISVGNCIYYCIRPVKSWVVFKQARVVLYVLKAQNMFLQVSE